MSLQKALINIFSCKLLVLRWKLIILDSPTGTNSAMRQISVQCIINIIRDTHLRQALRRIKYLPRNFIGFS